MHVAVLDTDLGTHLLQRGEVQVDGPGTDGTASGQRHNRFAPPSQQRAEHQDRRAHRLDKFVRSLARGNSSQCDSVAIPVDLDARAQVSEDLRHGQDVPHIRHVEQGAGPLAQQGGGEDRQRGVLGPADADLACEAPASLNDHTVHQDPLTPPAPTIA